MIQQLSAFSFSWERMVGVAGVASCWMRKTLKRRKVIWWLACSWTAGTVEDFLTVMGEGASWPSSSNVYLFRDDKGFIMVDVGCGGRVGRLLEEMRAKGVKPNDVHTVLLTHAHPDHMGGIAEFLRYAKARVIIHELEAPAAMKPEVLEERFDVHLCVKHYGSFFTGHFSLLSYFESVCPMSKVTPDETVREGDVLEFGDYSFRVLRTPGHALGHTSLYEEREGFLLSGDLIGATVAWYSPSSGGVIGYLESLRKVERLKEFADELRRKTDVDQGSAQDHTFSRSKEPLDDDEIAEIDAGRKDVVRVKVEPKMGVQDPVSHEHVKQAVDDVFLLQEGHGIGMKHPSAPGHDAIV